MKKKDGHMRIITRDAAKDSIQYKASITREKFMFFEMRTTAKFLAEGLTEEETVDRIIVDNLFQYPTGKQIRTHAIACIKRLRSLEDAQLVRIIAFSSSDVAKQVCLYAMMKFNHLVWDFMVTVIGEKYRTNDLSFGKIDLNIYFIRLQEQIDSVSTWSVETVAKAKQVLLRILVENEYLDSTKSDHLNPVWLDPELENAIREHNDQAVLPAFNCLD